MVSKILKRYGDALLIPWRKCRNSHIYIGTYTMILQVFKSIQDVSLIIRLGLLLLSVVPKSGSLRVDVLRSFGFHHLTPSLSPSVVSLPSHLHHLYLVFKFCVANFHKICRHSSAVSERHLLFNDWLGS